MVHLTLVVGKYEKVVKIHRYHQDLSICNPVKDTRVELQLLQFKSFQFFIHLLVPISASLIQSVYRFLQLADTPRTNRVDETFLAALCEFLPPPVHLAKTWLRHPSGEFIGLT